MKTRKLTKQDKKDIKMFFSHAGTFITLIALMLLMDFIIKGYFIWLGAMMVDLWMRGIPN